MNYIFGYGSLITPIGINGRKMSRVYTQDDLTLALLHGCKREWNIVYKGQKYLGLIVGLEPLLNFANGVIFPISDADLVPFKESEGIGEKFDPPLYTFEDVTAFVITSLQIKPEDRIFTCVTVNPSSKGIIPEHYYHILANGFDIWGPEFEQLFVKTTFPKGPINGSY